MQPLKRAIILCWVMLVGCFAVKLFGGNWFEVVCTNEHFANFCAFVQNNDLAFEMASFILYVFPSYIIMMCISFITKPNKKQWCIMSLGILLVWACRAWSLEIKSVAEILNAFCMPIILNYLKDDNKSWRINFKNTWYYGIVGYLVILCFQIVSLVTRNIGIKFVSDNVLVTFILLIDYYIMLCLYYLYIKLKKESNNG